jgi:hypothetical protein
VREDAVMLLGIWAWKTKAKDRVLEATRGGG